jgi:Lrp/AsnC family leucine-responsive transcriptional regulator
MINSRLDATDIAILCELQSNGRIKNVELAEKVSLSPSPCLQRVRRLEKIGLNDKNGNVTDWWTEDDYTKFEA